MRIKIAATCLLVLALLAGQSPALPAAQKKPPQRQTPAGQVNVLSVNAWQNRTLDVLRFRRLLELTLAIRDRPPAFNGGAERATAAPDIIVLQEITTSNLEILRRLILQRFSFRYEAIDISHSKSKLLYNEATVTPVGEPTTWIDACPAEGEDERTYTKSRFLEHATGTEFTVAGTHLWKAQSEECRLANSDLLLQQAAEEPGPFIVAGDFNRRPVEAQYDCDPNELTLPLEWRRRLMAGETGEVFVDAVATARARRGDIAQHWTHEQRGLTVSCNGSAGHRRARLDYIFATDVEVAEAAADNPGWAGKVPGTYSKVNPRYSDHRFLWARLVISGPLRPTGLTATPQIAGDIALSWTPAEDATGYVIYRSLRGQLFRRVGAVTGTNMFTDSGTRHATNYRYVVAAVGPNGGNSRESTASWATADAIGPRRVAVSPRPGAEGVSRSPSIQIRFDERVDPASVDSSTIMVFGNGNRVGGNAFQSGTREIKFRPYTRLRKKTWYRVVVKPVQDALGNQGPKVAWSFKTGK